MSRNRRGGGCTVPAIEIELSADRKTATITGSEGHDPWTILILLIVANVHDLLIGAKSAPGRKHLVAICKRALPGLSETAISERLKWLQYRLRSNESRWRFVQDAMLEQVLEAPEGQSVEEAIERDLRRNIALDLARVSAGATGITTIPNAKQVEERVEEAMSNPDWQVFARIMGSKFFLAAINGKLPNPQRRGA